VATFAEAFGASLSVFICCAMLLFATTRHSNP
jgi:hypothetical protein